MAPDGVKRRLAALALLLLAAGPGQAARFEFHDRDDGISCSYFDVGLGIEWPAGRPGGLDADGLRDGTRPYASQRIDTAQSGRVVRLDLTTLVQEWWSGQRVNDGLLVQLVSGSYVVFHSREETDIALRPQLVLEFADGRRKYLEPQADASLDCSSIRGLGRQPLLVLKGSSALALRFELGATTSSAAPKSAQLLLVRTAERAPEPAMLVVRRLFAPIGKVTAPRRDGIAGHYPGDERIGTDPDVLFADGFESTMLDHRWSRGMKAPSRRVVPGELRDFQPLAGAALRVKIPKGGQVGLDLRYRFKQQQGSEPDEIYFRYYLWLNPDWLRASEGGKLPGLAATYSRAAWGDRPWDGAKGWSLRGAYHPPPKAGHPAGARMMLGSYAYHAKADPLGQPMPWPGNELAALVKPGRWYCIEQHVRLNTPRREDGVFQVWLDGALVLDRSDLRLRDVFGVHIEEVWMNFFHGGGGSPPVDIHAYIDGVVVARRYIGPMRH